MNLRTANFFDRYAHDFNALYGSKKNLPNALVDKLFRRSMKLRFEMTLRGCDPIADKHVLDIGCGPGHYSVELARRGAAGVLGIDIAPAMVDLASHQAAQAGVTEVCRFELADFLDYPFERGFDYIVAMGFMDYLRDPEAVLIKALSLCGDRCFFSFPVEGGLLAWQRKLRYRERCELYMYSRERIEQLFAPLGFRRIEVQRIARDFFVTASTR
jgi:2-polyprenyl-3-methyl-5-hydroxy-6-metoxy-1,4-benzoquinol methylase